MLNTSGTKSNRSTSFSRSKNVLGESDVTTLQREVDNYIRKLEQEKRRLAAIEETYSMVLKEMSDKKKRLEQTQNPTKTEQQKNLTQIKNLENQLEMTVTKYNEIVAKNNKLRDEIDVLRRERTSFLQVYRNMQVELDNTNKETVAVKGTLETNTRKIETTQSKIHTLQFKNEKEKAKYFQQFEDLERDMKDMMKRKDLGLKAMPKTKEKAENIDTHTLLKRRLQKIIFNNKDKVKIIEQYIKNMRYIDEAFTQIKEATGITDVDEIVNTFIKSEEQNLSLMNYASLLSQDIDMYEEMNKDLGKEIEELEIMKRQRMAEIEGNEQEKEKKRIKSMIETKKKEITDLKGRIENLQQSVEPMLTKFSATGIQNHVLGRYNYDAGVAINDNNAEQYLAELEDYLDTFLLYLAKSKETPENPYILKPGMWEEVNLDSSDAHVAFDLNGKEPNLKELGNILDSSNLESHFMKWEDMERIGNETLEKKKAAQPVGNSFNAGHPSIQQSNNTVDKPVTKLPEIPAVHRSINKKGTKIGEASPSKQ